MMPLSSASPNRGSKLKGNNQNLGEMELELSAQKYIKISN